MAAEEVNSTYWIPPAGFPQFVLNTRNNNIKKSFYMDRTGGRRNPLVKQQETEMKQMATTKLKIKKIRDGKK